MRQNKCHKSFIKYPKSLYPDHLNKSKDLVSKYYFGKSENQQYKLCISARKKNTNSEMFSLFHNWINKLRSEEHNSLKLKKVAGSAKYKYSEMLLNWVVLYGQFVYYLDVMRVLFIYVFIYLFS